MAECQQPCDPCHFGGYKQVISLSNDKQRVDFPFQFAEKQVKVAEVDAADCKEISERKNENPCTIPPKANAATAENNRLVPPGDPPCYLPQPTDQSGGKKDDDSQKMGPIGPWATGRVDWGPLAGLTGTRPVVAKYSISRYSEGEWRKRNEDILNNTHMEEDQFNLVAFQSAQIMEKARADADKDQADSTKRLSQRSTEVHRWKCELEKAIEAAAEELAMLKDQHTRLKQSMAILMIPEAIAGECLDIRTGRLEPDLVRDEAEEELIREMALTAEIRDIFTRTLGDLTHIITEEKAAKVRLEFDWSDKKTAFEVEALGVGFNNRSTVIMFKPGATIYPAEQSSAEYWEHFTRESLEIAERTRQKAVNLRGTLDAILINAARDLRSQADKADAALARRIACSDELRLKLEQELQTVLKQLVDTEKLIDALQLGIRNMDGPMKVAQSRMNNKLYRPRVENCRDGSYFGIINEVKSISKTVAALTAQLNSAEKCRANLLQTRSNLEREIMIKLRTLQIDKERLQLIRSHYPSSAALSGY